MYISVKIFYTKFIDSEYFAGTDKPCGSNSNWKILRCLMCEKILSVSLKSNGNIYRHLRVS